MSDVAAAESAAHSAIAEVADAASDAIAADATRIIEAAEERVEGAERAAEQLAEAAMMTQLGQRIDELRRDVLSWLEPLNQSLSALTMKVEEMAQTPAAPTVVAVTTETAPQPLIPQPSAEPQTETTVTIVEPSSVSADGQPVAETVVPPKKVRRLM